MCFESLGICACAVTLNGKLSLWSKEHNNSFAFTLVKKERVDTFDF